MAIKPTPDFEKKFYRLLYKICFSWKNQQFYMSRMDVGVNEIKSLFIQEGWTPPKKDE